MLIGELARRTGVPTGTIRFYERKRLVAVPVRSSAGYRRYSEQAIAEIGFIRKAQRIGFSLEEIREILSLGKGGRMPCARVAVACETHLKEIDRRMAELRTYRLRFRATLRQAQGGCGFTAEGFCRAILGS